MAFNDTFIPKSPINVPLPNFNKGMVRNKASTVLPEGAVFLASNYNITEKGPTRRSGSIKFAGGAVVSYAPLRDTVQLFKTDGTQKIGVLDTKFLYVQSGTNLVRQSIYTSAGTIRTSGAHVRGNGATTFTAAALRVNDTFSPVVNENNLIDRGDCESATPPALAGQTAAGANCTFARSSLHPHSGTYNLTISNTAGGACYFFLTTLHGTTDLNGFIPGHTYVLNVWLDPPSEGISVNQFYIDLPYYSGGAWHYPAAFATVLNSYQLLTLTITLPANTTGAYVEFDMGAGFAGNEFYVDDITLYDLKEELIISQVVTKSHLILATAPVSTYPNGTAYKAHKAFDYNKSLFVDWTLCDSKIVLSDGIRPLWAWNGTTMAAFAAGLTFVPRAVAYWMDRLFCLYTVESGLTYRSRTRWSTTTDHTSFIGSPDIQWQDRPYSAGAGLRLVPMGKLLIAYYEDRIDIGRPTNIAGDVLPVYFEQVDTGGAGLVGMKAVTRFYDGHFVMLDDGIYYFSAASGVPQSIGEEIWKEATGGLKTLQGVIAAIDWQNDCVLFAIPNNSFLIQTLWAYNYKSKAWSRQEIPCTSLSVMMQTQAPTIDGAVGTIDAQTGTFDDLATSYKKQIAFGRAGALAILDPGASDDYDGSLIPSVIETGDFSWQAPNDIKRVFALSLKVDRLLETETYFTVEGSTNRGLSWKALGTLVIGPNDDENQVGFRLMGSMIRFRLTTSTRIAPFTVVEVVLRMRGGGRELRFSTAD